jgi:DNA-binding CsgD family transcriptional regulator
MGAVYPLAPLIPQVISDADELALTGPELASAGKPDPLTSREHEIAALVAEGLSNREIAVCLVVSKRTVDAHVEQIYAKLGISSRVQLANWLKPQAVLPEASPDLAEVIMRATAPRSRRASDHYTGLSIWLGTEGADFMSRALFIGRPEDHRR